jgi:hypothetical protein
MLRCTYAFATIAIASFLLARADAAAAAPQRTFVASTGVDSNPCTLALPCRGFAAAVSAVADSGEVVVLDSAAYGSFTIDKSVTVTSPAGVYAGISVFSGNDGIVIDGPGVLVTLKGLTINGQGGDAGINFLQGAELIIENCQIAHVGGNGTAGIFAQAPGGKVVVRDTVVRDTAHVGIWVRQTTGGETTTLVADNVAVHNASPFGIYLGGTNHIGAAEAYLTHVTVTGSSNIGVTADSSTGGKSLTLASVANSTISENGIGVEANRGKIIVATSVLVRNAGYAMLNLMGVIGSRGDNTVHDNNGGAPSQVFGAIGSLTPM